MLGNGVAMSLIFHGLLCPLLLGWAPNHTVSRAQLATGKKVRFVSLKSVDTDEMQQFVAFHLGLHCL